MFRILGVLCIFMGSIGLGWSLRNRMKDRLSALYTIRQMFHMIQNEITYSKAPLTEACRRISVKLHEPYQSALIEIYEKMSENCGCSFHTVWKQCMEKCLKTLPISEEEKNICLHFGDCAGYMDGRMQAESLEQYMHNLDLAVSKLEDDMTNKSKVIMSLSIMGGMLTAIILL